MIRIVWRFDRSRTLLEELLGDRPAAVSGLEFDSLVETSPVFDLDQESPEAELENLPGSMREDSENDLARYFQAYVEDETEARPILAALEKARRQGRIEWFDSQAEIAPQLPTRGLEQARRIQCPPDPGGATRAWDECQVYLGPPDASLQTPSGVDARFAWGLKGGRGQRVGIVDVEGGWLLDHEDLDGQVSNQIGNFPFAPQFEAHGTAVLGILCANPQNPPRRMGVIGIAHGARVGVAPFQVKAGREPNPESVLKKASKWLTAGDVLLLELQATRSGSRTLLPIEAWPHGRAAINHAHGKGIYVVEVAANGGVTLSSTDHNVPNTGVAIMVGAGDIVTGRPLPLSNRGLRVDVQGWGDEVVTTGDSVTGYSDLQARVKPQRCYTRSFSGTSSAAAIVAGCVAVISSVVKAHGFSALTPQEMKSLLIQTGTFQDRTVNGGIGPLPNVRAALEALEARYQREQPGFRGFERIQGNAAPQQIGRNGSRKVRRSSVSLSTPSSNRNDRRKIMNKEQPTAEQVENAYRKALEEYSDRGNVTGVDVGHKYVAGEATDQTAIRIHVKQKVNPFALESDEAFPESIEGVPVDVIEAVYTPQAGNQDNEARRQRRDPIQPGLSVGHGNVTAGTLGAMVYDRATGRPGILSNWHVLVGSASAQPGDPILQPGRMDGGTKPQNAVATLTRSILNENGDAAVALLNGTRKFVGEQFGSGVRLGTARTVRRDDIVEKSGRTTGVTRGRVDGVGRYFIDYSVGRVGIDGFKIVAVKEGNPDNDEISSPGDSGSVWYNPDSKEALGLHFAGETDSMPGEEHALACHMPRVLTALNASLSPTEITTDAGWTGAQISANPALPQLSAVTDWLYANRESLLALLKALENGNGKDSDTSWRPNGRDISEDPQRVDAR